MTKNDLIKAIVNKTGLEKATIQQTVEAFMDSIKRSMVNNNNVYLRGFGSFVVVKRAKRTARNISKNTTIIIPAHSVPKFKPAFNFITEIKSKFYIKKSVNMKGFGFIGGDTDDPGPKKSEKQGGTDDIGTKYKNSKRTKR